MPYVASYILCFNKEGKIALLMRENTAFMNGFYGLPAGKTEKDERFSAAAIREAHEEIGLTINDPSIKYSLTMHRNSIEDDKSVEQWVDVFFVVTDYKGEPFNAEPDVHSELIWVDPKALPDNIIPHHAAGIKAYLEGNTYIEFGW
jgi:8-oxo-dGTP pyrophosphatase MutT (NUDIX family)